jgi:hypothetical protein
LLRPRLTSFASPGHSDTLVTPRNTGSEARASARPTVSPLKLLDSPCAKTQSGEVIDVRRAVRSQLTILLLLGAVVLLAVPAVPQEQTGTLLFVGPAAEPQTLLLD